MTHRDRIKELRDCFLDDQFDDNHENIEAAISYHQSFPDLDTRCESTLAYFFKGKRVESGEIGMPCWSEVGGSPVAILLELMWLLICTEMFRAGVNS